MTDTKFTEDYLTLVWPDKNGAEVPLLVFEVQDPRPFRIEGSQTVGLPTWLLERGFRPLQEGVWEFPYLDDHVFACFREFGMLSLIDEAGELIDLNRNKIVPEWMDKLYPAKKCLLIAGTNLELKTKGMDGVREAARRGDAFAASVPFNDGNV